jgi:hypothetical protein
MTKNVTRKQILFAVLLGLLILTTAWAYGRMNDQRQAARRAQEDRSECERCAADIAKMAHRPDVASEREKQHTETLRRIEAAAQLAGVTAGNLVRITPEPARRLEDTVYKEKPTQVLLRNVSLKQVVTFAHSLTGGAQALNPKSLRLTSPRPEDTSDRWTAELVLTYLVYDPPQPPTLKP